MLLHEYHRELFVVSVSSKKDFEDGNLHNKNNIEFFYYIFEQISS